MQFYSLVKITKFLTLSQEINKTSHISVSLKDGDLVWSKIDAEHLNILVIISGGNKPFFVTRKVPEFYSGVR